MERKDVEFLRTYSRIDAFLHIAFWLGARVCQAIAVFFLVAGGVFAIRIFLNLHVTTATNDFALLIVSGVSGCVHWWLGCHFGRISHFFKPLFFEGDFDPSLANQSAAKTER